MVMGCKPVPAQAGPQAVQGDAVLAQARHDVDQIAAAGLRLEAPIGIGFQSES